MVILTRPGGGAAGEDPGGLTDEHAYDLAWLPAPFIPPAALSRGAERVARALGPLPAGA